MTRPGQPLLVRIVDAGGLQLVGAGGILVGIGGVLSTAGSLQRLFVPGVLEGTVRLAGFAFGAWMLVANFLDLAAYIALLVVAGMVLAGMRSARRAGLVLGAYFAFMAIAQPLGEYFWLYRPLKELRGETASVTGFAPQLWACLLWLAYALALLVVMYGWGRATQSPADRPPAPRAEAMKPPETPRPAAGPVAAGARGTRAATNAPRHWRPVHIDDWLPPMPMYAQLAVVTTLSGYLKESGGSLSLMRSLLYDDGVVGLPVVVEEGGQRTAVFIYPEVNAESAAHYSAARTLLRQREGMNAVYYAPEPLMPARPATIVAPLGPDHFSRPKAEPPPAEYALWWPTTEEPLLRDSAAPAHLDEWFESLDGYGYLLFSSFAESLELAPSGTEPEVYGLPVQPLMVPVEGPNDLALYLHASQDEGLWFAFDAARTSPTLRNRLLGQLAAAARRFRQAVEASGKLPSSKEEEGRALYFWRRARQQALDLEATGASGMRLGSILEVGPARARLPGASTAEERQAIAQATRPGEGLIDFARAQIEHAVGLLKGRTRDAQAVNEPNLHPFIAVLKQRDVVRVSLWAFDEPDARAMLPLVAAEHAGLEAIALVCDGIVRLDGDRFDALVVRAHQAGERSAHVFTQRYALSKGNVQTLGNWLLQGAEDALAMEATPGAEGPRPSPGLGAFLAQIVDATLEWVRTGDESGAEIYREGEPLFSPALHVRVGDQTHMKRFMMGNLLWAQGASLEVLAESREANLAVFVYDWVADRNGEPARSLRFHAHERGAGASWLYALPYAVPARGRRFDAAGALTLVRTGRPLFPA